jgi:hypothetical protein
VARTWPDLDVEVAAQAVLGPFPGGSGSVPVVSSRRRFLDATLQFRIAGAGLHEALTAAFEHLPTLDDDDAPADLEIVASDSTTTPSPLRGLGHGPGRATLADDRGGVEVLAAEPSMTVLQATDRRLGYWAEGVATIPVWQRASPFRTAMHWWLADRGLQLVHAAAVAVDGHGLLIAGGSGSGKSTTALRCARGGLGYAGDDYVVVDPGSRVVHSLYSSGKADLGRLRADPELLPNPLLPTLAVDDKAVTFLGRERPEVVATGFTAVGLVVAEVRGGGSTTVEPLSRRDALAALSVTTLHQLPGDRAGTLRRAVEIVSTLPCRRLVLGTDHQRIPSVIASLIEDLAP